MTTFELELAYQTSAARVYDLLEHAGYRPCISERLLRAALDVQAAPDPSHMVKETTSFFSTNAAMIPHGLDSLPTAWLRQIPGILWRSRKPHWTSIPYMIRRLSFEQGVLCVSFAQELPNGEDRLTAWDRLRVLLNLELRPNIWKPLPKALERRIWDECLGARAELFRVL